MAKKQEVLAIGFLLFVTVQLPQYEGYIENATHTSLIINSLQMFSAIRAINVTF